MMTPFLDIKTLLQGVKEEVAQMCRILGEEVSTILACDIAGLGEGRTDGTSRAMMIKEVERLRAGQSVLVLSGGRNS